jgi:hypothetical protein
VHGVFTDQIGFKTVDALYPKKYPDRVQFVSRNLQPGAAMKTTWVRKAVWTAVMAVAAGGAWAQEKLRIAGNFAPDHSSSVAMQQFKKEVDAASKGTLVIEVFDNMQLGGAQENVTQTRAGTIHMTWVGMAFLSRTVPELEAVSLPFMFPSREVAYKVMDGPAVRPDRGEDGRQGLHLARLHGAGRAPGHQQRAADQDHGRPQGPEDPHAAQRDAPGHVPRAGRQPAGDGHQGGLFRAGAEGDRRP